MSDNDDLETVRAELRVYQANLAYLADIAAATACGLLDKKSTGAGERKRQIDICVTAARMLEGELVYHAGRRTEGVVAHRIAGIVARHSTPPS